MGPGKKVTVGLGKNLAAGCRGFWGCDSFGWGDEWWGLGEGGELVEVGVVGWWFWLGWGLGWVLEVVVEGIGRVKESRGLLAGRGWWEVDWLARRAAECGG
jgi:hypothetical protein